jgi:hypothetical protein
MRTVARDLYASFRIFAALATVLFVICYGALACRMCTFVELNISHDNLSFLSTECGAKNITAFGGPSPDLRRHKSVHGCELLFYRTRWSRSAPGTHYVPMQIGGHCGPLIQAADRLWLDDQMRSIISRKQGWLKSAGSGEAAWVAHTHLA